MATQGFEQGHNAPGVLRANPIEFEAVGRVHGDLGEVFADAGRQWLDPGVVLLFWQVVAELFNTGQPQPLTRVVQGIFGHSQALGMWIEIDGKGGRL